MRACTISYCLHDQPAPLCRALEQRIACTISLRDLESTPRLGAGKHGAVRKNGVHGQFAVACVGCRKQCGSAWLVLDGQHVSSPRQWPARGKTCARAFLVEGMGASLPSALARGHILAICVCTYVCTPPLYAGGVWGAVCCIIHL